jgi:membrane-bound lytic murein transglycosylase D
MKRLVPRTQSQPTRRLPGGIGLLPVAALCLITGISIFGCGSTAAPELSETAARIDPDPSYRQWEEATRQRTDDLITEAQRLADEGRHLEALDRIDEALCLVLDPPEDYVAEPGYLDYAARLLAEAESLEHRLDIEDEDGVDVEELVALPPIEITELEVEEREPTEPGVIPPSEYPLVRNSTVEQFLEAMTREGEYRNRIETGLRRSGDYLPMIRSKFGAAGLPLELSYLPLIESAFSLKAYSRARAHGMWQFISSTGRHYGLEIGSLVDERRDPVRSTEAAVAYLTDLHAEFDDWYLALAAYNSGAGNVRRAVRRSGSRDFWALRRYLPRETRNYVPGFIASVIIAKDPDSWGFPTPVEREWDFDAVEVPDALDLQFLAKEIDLPLDELRELNPAIRRDLTPANNVTMVRLPSGMADTAERVLAEVPRSEWAPRMIHTVRRGESLYTIAQRYNSSVGAIKQANNIRGSLIHPGQSLIVPRLGISYGNPATRSAENGSYVVQRNDTLWDIARSFGVSVDSLCAANGLSRRSVIQPGQRLTLPDGSVSTGVPASSAASTTGWSSSYTVRRGDTLSGIAARHRVTVTELRRANGMTGSRIYPGNTLRVPGSGSTTTVERTISGTRTYRVQKGDTLYDIARHFGVSVKELRRLNGLTTSRIYPGDVLRIPANQAKG